MAPIAATIVPHGNDRTGNFHGAHTVQCTSQSAHSGVDEFFAEVSGSRNHRLFLRVLDPAIEVAELSRYRMLACNISSA